MEKITPDLINRISYTDFVGLINQWNVLPGAITTISEWVIFSRVNKGSNILEVACTTGFSSREMALMTGCKGVGFDLSAKSIANAKYNKNKYAKKIRVEYLNADGYKFKPKNKFTHIIVGASLKFFPDPNLMLDRCVSFLEDGGFILASPFYIDKPIPKALIKKAQGIFGITPTTEGYKQIMKSYKHLEIFYENRKYIVQETEEELAHYCNCTTDRACEVLKIADNSTKQAIYRRLYSIKEMSNLLRPYQKYSVLVLRKRKDIYPNRFIELF